MEEGRDSYMVKIHYKSWVLIFFPKKFYGFTFGQHIFFRYSKEQTTPEMISHEKVHAKQYRKHGTIKFLWIYFIKEWRLPYKEKSFEIEAYNKK